MGLECSIHAHNSGALAGAPSKIRQSAVYPVNDNGDGTAGRITGPIDDLLNDVGNVRRLLGGSGITSRSPVWQVTGYHIAGAWYAGNIEIITSEYGGIITVLVVKCLVTGG